MKKISIIFLLLVFIPILIVGYGFETTYDVVGIYKKSNLPYGTKVINTFGSIEDASALLTPTKIESGVYKVRIKKMSSGIYEIVNKDIILEVKSSYSLSYNNEYKLEYGESLLDLSSSIYTYGSLGKLVTSD